ncbi:MAG: tRNA epoxyqueuosine(34) reductase QueG [Minwuia sp.]|nr:tRNA epoxyqueuosine(34) reductase QueG [Minwuia sp.]
MISEAARQRLKDRIAARSVAVGFADIGFTGPQGMGTAAARLNEFVALGRHGDMGWLQDRAEWRGNPAALWPDARSVIMLATDFAPPTDPLLALDMADHGAVSVYAARRDYHDVVKGRLKQLAQGLLSEARQMGITAEVKVFVDTAPVMEKPLAAKAGLGWQGKHTNLVSRRLGSWTFLGAIFTTLDLPADQPSPDHCGSCTRCLDICPTKAFPSAYQLDATRCIAYLTVEHQGQIPQQFRTAIGNRIFGCDDCLAVCPWNRFAETSQDMRLQMRGDLQLAPLTALLDLDDAAFRQMFAGTPVKRLGRDRFLRNVLVAVGNTGQMVLIDQVRALLADSSPLVRGMAVWALSCLVPAAEFAVERARHQSSEEDAQVLSEWRVSGTLV